MLPLTWGVLGLDAIITLTCRNSGNLMWSWYRAETEKQVNRVFKWCRCKQIANCVLYSWIQERTLSSKSRWRVCLWLQLYLFFHHLFFLISHSLPYSLSFFSATVSQVIPYFPRELQVITGILPKNFSFLLWSLVMLMNRSTRNKKVQKEHWRSYMQWVKSQELQNQK